MEKTNWKIELKRELKNSFKELVEMMYTMFCMTLVTMFSIFSQTDKQLNLIQQLVDEKAWLVLFCLVVGVVVLSRFVELVLKGVFKFFRFVVLVILKRWKW